MPHTGRESRRTRSGWRRARFPRRSARAAARPRRERAAYLQISRSSSARLRCNAPMCLTWSISNGRHFLRTAGQKHRRTGHPGNAVGESCREEMLRCLGLLHKTGVHRLDAESPRDHDEKYESRPKTSGTQPPSTIFKRFAQKNAVSTTRNPPATSIAAASGQRQILRMAVNSRPVVNSIVVDTAVPYAPASLSELWKVNRDADGCHHHQPIDDRHVNLAVHLVRGLPNDWRRAASQVAWLGVSSKRNR